MDGQYWKGDRTMSTNEWLLTSDFWQFLEAWHGRWCEYEIFIASCTDNIYDLENERWLLGDIDHVGIYGSRVAESLSAFNGGLVIYKNHISPAVSSTADSICGLEVYQRRPAGTWVNNWGSRYQGQGQRSWKGDILVSPCPSVRLWTESCPLCIFSNTHQIHIIFAHLIKQLQKVCRV